MPEPTSTPRGIEFVLPSLEVGGMEMVVVCLARAFREAGWRVGITCTESLGLLAGAAGNAGITVVRVPAPGVRSMIHAPALTAHLHRQAPEFVLTHSGVWMRGAHAARAAGVPHVIHAIHGLLLHEPWYGPIEQWLAARHTDHIIAVSPVLETYLRTRARIRTTPITVIPNGIDTDRFTPAPDRAAARRMLGMAPTGILVGCIARLEPVKHLEALVRAMASVRESHPTARLVIVGDGSARAVLEAEASAAGIAGWTSFPGTVHNPEAWFSAMDIFVLPSLREAAPLSLIEAMASGCAVVATDVGSNRATLADGTAGIVVPVADQVALERALESLMSDARERQGYQARAVARAREHFSVPAMTRAYRDLIERLGDAPPA